MTASDGQNVIRRLAEPASFNMARAWYLLVILELQVWLVGIDVAIVSLLVRPIEVSLNVSDVVFTTITTTPFFIGISLIYYPAGLLADALRRRNLIAIGALLWAFSALIAARSNSPAALFFARMCAGIGTGITGPSFFSLITDAFPRRWRAIALSGFTAGIAVGSGIGVMLLGHLIARMQSNGVISAFGMKFAPWQQCFLVVFAAGIVAALAIYTVHEPLRGGQSTSANYSVSTSVRTFIGYMRENALLWTLLLFGYSFASVSYFGIVSWAPTFGTRAYGGSVTSLVALYGTFLTTGTLVGSFGGGVWAQRLINTGKSRLLPLVLCAITLAGGVLAATFPFMPTWTFAVAGIGIVLAATQSLQVLVPIGIQETTPNEVRGQLIGMLGLIGFFPPVLGATVVASLSSGALARFGGLGPALSLTGGLSCLIAALLFGFALGPYQRAVGVSRAAMKPAVGDAIG